MFLVDQNFVGGFGRVGLRTVFQLGSSQRCFSGMKVQRPLCSVL